MPQASACAAVNNTLRSCCNVVAFFGGTHDNFPSYTSLLVFVCHLASNKVREWYVISYEEIRDFPRPVTVDQEVRFAELLKV